jgi:hypothetical protein
MSLSSSLVLDKKSQLFDPLEFAAVSFLEWRLPEHSFSAGIFVIVRPALCMHVCFVC